MLFRHLGLPELLIILLVVVLLFGPGRIGRIGSELGKSIRGFRESIGNEKEEKDDDSTSDEA